MAKRPNIVLLVLDSVRTSNMSCYGYERPTTPHLDRLVAEEAALFEQAIAVGCWTLPVHASLFTGLYPSAHGVMLAKDALPEGTATLARRLGERGYRTACFSNNPYISESTGLTQGFDTVEELWRNTRLHGAERSRASARLKQLERRGGAAKSLARAARLVKRPLSILKTWRRWRSHADSGAKLTQERVREWLASKDDTAPFFIFVNFMESHEGWKSHERYNPPRPYNRRFLGRRISFWRVARLTSTQLGASKPRREQDLQITRALYDGAVNYLDDQVGELMNHLDSIGVMDNTVLIVASDHGDSLGEHGHVGHRLYLYEQLVHVPLIVRYPACFAPGSRISHLVQLCDLYPAILELAGDGDSEASHFKSLLGARDVAPHAFVVAENTAPKSLDNVVMRMVRDERFKYIASSNGREELYDLIEDPGESRNLAGSEPSIQREMSGRLREWESSLETTRMESGEAEYDEETMERLRGLGYVG
jgi:arylsulfatase A-like enzyme